MGSTLVETVNINLEDFSESFLTCATCLCTYDQEKRKAKLLPCSHTVCLRCLERMEQLPQVVETGVLRCPMCREITMLPTGGATMLPSSFLINQLLDLMQKQRRDVIPNCVVHQTEQLLYCEGCDLVFCQHCNAPSTRSCSGHNVIPFSIAIKRMSEIVVFKAKQCVANLNQAAKNVESETLQLDKNVDRIVEELNASFQEVCQLVENRRRELVDSVRMMRDEKRKVLRDQMEMIDAHRKKLERELESLQVDVREMATRTKRVMEATEEALALAEPRENAFLKLHTEPKKLLQEMEKSLSEFGTISGSTTFPGQSTVEVVGTSNVFIENRLLLKTRTVDGRARNSGGDPVKAEIFKKDSEKDENESDPIGGTIKDNDDGTYSICFRVCEAGNYVVRVTIFGRPVKNSPLYVPVTNHYVPKWQFGSYGLGALQLNQPVKICQNREGGFYILDTGNNRIKLLDKNGEYVRDIGGKVLNGCSTVGMTLLPTGDILTLNWRTKEVSKCGPLGEPLQTMSFSEFVEPIDICVDSRGRFLIADTACAKVFVFDSAFRPLFSFSVSAQSSNSAITCICVGLNDDILVGTCSSLLLYDGGGSFVREMNLCGSPTRSRTMTSACAVCPQSGNVLAAVVNSKKNRAHLAVCQYKGSFLFAMDNQGSRLRRPCGVCIGTAKWADMCFVADSATHCIKAFQFK